MKTVSRNSAKWFFRAILVALLLFFGCMVGDVAALTIEDERMMGQEFVTFVKQRFQVLDDEFADRYINDLGQYLLQPIETKYFPYHFYLIQDHTLNAFAGPAGHLFFFSGLIEEMDALDELVSVMCHEIAHVTSRHLAHRIEKGKKIGIATMAGILAGVLIGGTAAEALVTGSMAAGIQAELHYSRNDERQADQLGFQYTAAAGFDPKAMITVLNKIQRISWYGSDKVPSYLLTHPTGPERMANIETLLSHYAAVVQKQEAERFRAQFPFFKAVVRAKSLDPLEAERLFTVQLDETEQGKKPKPAVPHFGLGILYKELSEPEPAIEHLKKALETEPAFIPILTHLAEAYQMLGRDREAVRILERALTLNRNDKSVLYLLALSHENQGQHRRAIALFERLAAFAPVKKEVYYHLGLSYGRLNRLALAHYHFGIYFRESGKRDKAEFHFRKAEGLAGRDPVLKKRIQDARDEMG